MQKAQLIVGIILFGFIGYLVAATTEYKLVEFVAKIQGITIGECQWVSRVVMVCFPGISVIAFLLATFIRRDARQARQLYY